MDPEEAFVASLSSCHMLFCLSIGARRGFTVDHYVDDASGTLEKNADGQLAITKVILRPNASYSGEKVPTRAQLEKIHHRAHAMCFIANSVRSEVITELVS